MAGKYNKKNVVHKATRTVNLAGGEAFKESDKLALVSLVLTSFASDQFYRGENETLTELIELANKVNPLFAAKAAVYARNEYGMRSITHVLAAELAQLGRGTEWIRRFYNAVVHRPDDMLEIVSAYKAMYPDEPLPNAMKAGLRMAFNKFDGYQLAKYRAENKEFKLVDLVNLVHPHPTEKNANALNQLVNGKLKSVDTWESKLSGAGSDEDAKSEAWSQLLSEKKIGYFALLRNLRNILEQAPDMVDTACELLVDEKLIKKSLVLPFRFLTAKTEIEGLVNNKNTRKVLAAINDAVEISLANVPEFSGDTLVVLDQSGSMGGRPAEIGSLFTAVLAKANNADVMTFSSDAHYRKVDLSDSIMSIVKKLAFDGSGTNFHAIFQRANSAYDRIIILSDMQGWMGYDSPKADFKAYCKKYDCKPKIFSFDLQGYGTLQFPEPDVFCLAGFSDKTLDLLHVLDTDKNALIKKIENVEF